MFYKDYYYFIFYHFFVSNKLWGIWMLSNLSECWWCFYLLIWGVIIIVATETCSQNIILHSYWKKILNANNYDIAFAYLFLCLLSSQLLKIDPQFKQLLFCHCLLRLNTYHGSFIIYFRTTFFILKYHIVLTVVFSIEILKWHWE